LVIMERKSPTASERMIITKNKKLYRLIRA
jgi:hypothetical protein